MHAPANFYALREVPENAELSAAVVFLRASKDGWFSVVALKALTSLATFVRFDRGLHQQKAPFKAQWVKKTVGLFSSPGVVVLHGQAHAVEQDANRIRCIEAEAITEEL